VEPAELTEIVVDREVFRVFLGLLPTRPRGEAGMTMIDVQKQPSEV